MALVSRTYNRFYEGFDVFGDVIASAEDVKSFDDAFFRQNPAPSSVEFSDVILEVEPGFLGRFPTLAEIIVPDTVEKIGLTAEEKAFLHGRNVVVRGLFDSYAERFAREQELRFMHSDVEIAQVGDYATRDGVDIITICFRPKGDAFVHQDCRCSGSSAGSVGGGSIDFDLPRTFWKTWTPEKFEQKCWGTCSEAILQSEALKKFLAGAQARKGYRT